MTFRPGQRFSSQWSALRKSRRLRTSDRPTLQIEPLESRQLLTADINPVVLHSDDLSPTVEAAFRRVSDLSQYTAAELATVTSWVAHLTDGHDTADIASLLQIDSRGLSEPTFIDDTVIFDQAGQPDAGPFATSVNIAGTLGASDVVDYFYPLVSQQRSNRAAPNDPLFAEQWHLFNTGQSGGTQGADGNVVNVWDEYTGDGIVISVVDDAVQGTHPDLAANYRSDLSFDYLDNDADASPEASDDSEAHGTAVAGVAAAVTNNNVGVAGVAPDAEIAGIRLIAGPITDSQEAGALGHEIQSIDISNNSWGPADGFGLGAPGPLLLSALETAVDTGRGGFGSVFVFAAGNGGQVNDWSNWDGYAGNRYTIGVAGVDHRGVEPVYGEPGSNILIAAPTNTGIFGVEGVTTTDLVGEEGYNQVPGVADFDGHPDLDYTEEFGGTSSAAPYVSGVIALMLEANRELSYRDVQHILVRTADMTDPSDPSWTINGAGRSVSNDYGFGAINAQAAVDLAEVWNSVAPLQALTTGELVETAITIPDADATGVTVPFTVPVALPDGTDISQVRLEHVEVTLSSQHDFTGDLEIILTSPDGSQSLLSRPNASDIGQFDNFTLTTVHHWDETVPGDWSIQIRDLVAQDEGMLNSLNVTFYGAEGPTTNPEGIPNDSGSISGIVFLDADRNGIQGAGEDGLGDRLVFIDVNSNDRFDVGELNTTTGPNGFYLFTNVTPGDYKLIDFTGRNSIPTGGIDATTQFVTVEASEDVFDVNFASITDSVSVGPAGTITGMVYNDANTNSMQDAGEEGIAGLTAYLDMNDNCIAGLGEPVTTTAADGSFSMGNLAPGVYNVRLMPSPGNLQALPCNGIQVTINANGIASTAAFFGITTSVDMNDGGPPHGEVPGFRLGNAINADDGLFFLTGLHAGATETVGIQAEQLSVSPAYLHMWIDFSGDGDWDDAGEQVFHNARLEDGFNLETVEVPSTATAGLAKVRARWALERDLGPFDPALAGETEDYLISIPSEGMSGLMAVDDMVEVDEDSKDNIIDVLANDMAGPFSEGFSLVSVGPTDNGGTAEIIDGILVYTPAADFVGVEKFTYTIMDALGGSSTATVCVMVNNTNDAPTAVDDSYTVDVNATGLLLPVLENDVDIDGDDLVILPTLSAPTGGGSVTVTGQGIFYVPATDFQGDETFTYEISDGNGGMDTATVTITVEEIPPIANFRLEVTNSNGASIDSVSAGENFLLRGYVEDLRDPALGVFSAYLDVLYDSGLVSTAGTLTDGGGPYVVARAGNTATAGEIDEVGGIVSGIRGGEDSSPIGSGEFLVFEILMQANVAGEAIFTGNPADVIPLHQVTVYGESVPLADSSISFTSDSLRIINDAPTANDDFFRVQTDTTDNVLAVLQNDTDLPTATNLRVTDILNGPANGSAMIAADGRSIIYTPLAGFEGLDMLSYEISDGQGGTDIATVDIEVTTFLVDVRLAATDLSGTPIDRIMEDESFQLQVFVEDLRSDPQGIFSVYTDVTYPAANLMADVIIFGPDFPTQQSGNLETPGLVDEAGATEDSTTPTGGGEFLLYTLTFTATEQGTVSFVSDPADILPLHETTLFGLSEPVANELIRFGTDSLVVESVGAQNDTATVQEDSTNNLIVVLDNDLNMSAGPLTIVAVSNMSSQGGTVMIDGDLVSYSPAPDFFGVDTFTYTIEDADGNVSSATVTVTVENTNDDPMAVNDEFDILIDSTANSLNVLTNDSSEPDPPEMLTIIDVTPPDNGGTAVPSADGSRVIYSPALGVSGLETFDYTISDGNGGMSTATVTVNLTDMLPPAVSFTFTVTDSEGSPLTSANVGDQFLLNVFVEDVRPDPRGVFSAYLDVVWSGGDADVNGDFAFGELYDSGQGGTFLAEANELDELGAVDGISEDLHDGAELLVSVPFTATVVGQLTFTGNPADLLPPDGVNETLLYGEEQIVVPERQDFGSVVIDVNGGNNVLLHNSDNPYDVNGDTAITPLDALSVVNALNESDYMSQQRTGAPLMLDVSDDGVLSPVDALLVINELGRATQPSGGALVGNNQGSGVQHTSANGSPIMREDGNLRHVGLVDTALAGELPPRPGNTQSNLFAFSVAADDDNDEADDESALILDISLAQLTAEFSRDG